MRSMGDFPKGEPLFPGSRARVWPWSAIRNWLEDRLGTERAHAALSEYLMLFFGLDEQEFSSFVALNGRRSKDAHLSGRQSNERDSETCGSPENKKFANVTAPRQDGGAEPHGDVVSTRKPMSTGSTGPSLSRRVR